MSNEKKKKLMSDAAAFTAEQLKAANIRNARVAMSVTGAASAYMEVQRAFGIEGSLSLNWEPQDSGGTVMFHPRLDLNFPACSKSVGKAMAFMVLVQEMTLLAASLQAQLDEEYPAVFADERRRTHATAT